MTSPKPPLSAADVERRRHWASLCAICGTAEAEHGNQGQHGFKQQDEARWIAYIDQQAATITALQAELEAAKADRDELQGLADANATTFGLYPKLEAEVSRLAEENRLLRESLIDITSICSCRYEERSGGHATWCSSEVAERALGRTNGGAG